MKSMKVVRNYLLIILGWIAFLLGAIGAFLPILPTTPFLLLASWLFSKGSPRFHHWLINLKYFGQRIKDWEAHGVIDLKSKIMASILISAMAFYIIVFRPYEVWIKVLMGLIFIVLLIFINSRPGKVGPK